MANISNWSTTASGNNSAAPDGFPEGMLPSGVNDAAREVMAAIRRWYEDAQWIDLGLTHTRTSAAQFTIAGDYTATYSVGRRLRMTGSATAFGTISAVSFVTPNTVVTVAESNVPATLATVSLGIVSNAAPQSQTVLAADGSAGAPSLSFFNDSDTGVFRSGSNALAVSTGGTSRASVGGGGNWTFSLPSSGSTITVNSDNNRIGLTVSATSGQNALIAMQSAGFSSWQLYASGSADRFGISNGVTDLFRIDAGGNIRVTQAIRAAGDLSPTTGAGTELGYTGGTLGYVQAYDRDSALWRDMTVRGRTLDLWANGTSRMVLETNGDVLARGVAITRVKTADTSRASTISLTDDPDLTVVVTQAGRYEFLLRLAYRTTLDPACGAAFSFSYTGTALGTLWHFEGSSGLARLESTSNLTALTSVVSPVDATTSSVGDFLVIRGHVNFSTTGTFALQWAQRSSNTSPTILMAGSYLKLTRLS